VVEYARWIDVNIEIILFKLLKGHKSLIFLTCTFDLSLCLATTNQQSPIKRAFDIFEDSQSKIITEHHRQLI
jgi:hypothetical protein